MIVSAIGAFAKQALLWGLALAPLAYVVLPVRTHTWAQVEVHDQTGRPIDTGTLLLLNGRGATLDRAPLKHPEGPARVASHGEPARVRVVAQGCEPFEGPLADCSEPELRMSDFPDYLKHGGATFFERGCGAQIELACAPAVR